MSLCAMAFVFLLAGAPAQAFPAEFGSGGGGGAGQFSSPSSLAVDNSQSLLDQSAGDVYVADEGNQRIDKFGPDGEFLLAWGWGVADGKEEFETCGPAVPLKEACQQGLRGSGSGQFARPDGVAVDSDASSLSDGDVYVKDLRNDRIDKFNENGKFLLAWGSGVADGKAEFEQCGPEASGGPAPCQEGLEGLEPGEFDLEEGNTISVGSSGTVYVGDVSRVQKFSEDGAYQGTVTIGNPNELIRAVAVDQTGQLYVIFNGLGGVHEYEACPGSCAGVEVGSPLEPAAGSGYSIALGPLGERFVDDNGTGRISEFDASGKEIARFAGPGANGITFADSAEQLLILTGGNVRALKPLPPPGPSIESQEAVAGYGGNETLKATIEPQGHRMTYHFEYGLEVSKEIATATVTMADEGFAEEQVEVTVSGLQPSSVYHFHVVAEDSEHHLVEGKDATFETFPAVAVESLSVTDVTATSARLEATVNPYETNTTYQFEYITGSTRSFTLEKSAGAGISGMPVDVTIQNLAPGSVYEYRVIAKNTLGSAELSHHEFTTQPLGSGFVLPDGREWEMVTPPQKLGAQVLGMESLGPVAQVSLQGNIVTYAAASPTEAEPSGYANEEQVLATRTSTGWVSKDIGIPYENSTGADASAEGDYQFFSEDLSLAVAQPLGYFMPSLSAEASEQTAYLHTDYLNGDTADPCGSSCYRPLVTGAPGYANVPPGTHFQGPDNCKRTGVGGERLCGPRFRGATPDLSHIVLSSEVALTETPFTEGIERHELYEWAAGRLTLISRLPGPAGEPTAPVEWPEFGGGQGGATDHAISDDGSRIFFSAGSPERYLYMRDMTREETIQIGGQEARFEGANAEGTIVFFSGDMCEITAHAGTGALECVPRGLGGSVRSGGGGSFVGASQDGSWMYFVSNNVLENNGVPVSGAVPGTCSGERLASELCNLYVRHEGTTRLVGVLSGADQNDWQSQTPGHWTSRVSPDGRYLAFMSQRDLTGYDTRDAVSGQPDEEVYLYNAEVEGGAGRLVCASCNPTGARPVGAEYTQNPMLHGVQKAWPPSTWMAANIPGWTPHSLRDSLYQSRYLSDNGRLFFNSNDALVPQDVNGTWDVYQYEPPGVGACTEGSSGFVASEHGCVGLVSSGTSLEESGFLDASATGGRDAEGHEGGGDVFFLTTAPLSSQDHDTAVDIYDAQECNPAAPCVAQQPVAPPVCDTGDSCKPAPTPQPTIFGATPSATFSGAGNAAPVAPTVVKKVTKKTVKCKRGFVKNKKGRCVKQKKHTKAKRSAHTNRRAK